jgi:hypothetical protein
MLKVPTCFYPVNGQCSEPVTLVVLYISNIHIGLSVCVCVGGCVHARARWEVYHTVVEITCYKLVLYT